MVRVFRSLRLVIAGTVEKELARQINYIKMESEALRSNLPKHIRITPEERRRLVRFTHEALVRPLATNPREAMDPDVA